MDLNDIDKVRASHPGIMTRTESVDLSDIDKVRTNQSGIGTRMELWISMILIR